MTERERDENIRNCATSLIVDNPALTRETAEAAVRKCFEAPDSAWIEWSVRAPSLYDGCIVGRDVLGFIHMATHLIGGRDGQWCEHWMSVRA